MQNLAFFIVGLFLFYVIERDIDNIGQPATEKNQKVPVIVNSTTADITTEHKF